MRPYIKSNVAQVIRQGTPPKRFELTEKQIQALKSIKDIALALGIVAGTLALSVMAPNIFQALDKMPWAKRTYRSRDTKWRDQQKKITRAIYYLKTHGYVELIPQGNDFQLRVLKKGRKKIRQMQFESLQVPSKNRWDGHWWLVLADIPSKQYRRQADFFREKLKTMNFYPLQRTVWVYPFDPRDEVDFVSAYYRIERFVTTMEIITLDPNDEQLLKRYFKEKEIL